jgi:gamma-glutamylcyclotransferase (GGCT)/AIG2-like uncharacterized protein YtfP
MQVLRQMTELQHVFVYGTLKQGQCREKCWPFSPVIITSAWTVGEMYDFGPYPAMVPGNFRIAGQLWSYRKQDILAVIKVLDRIEVTNQPGIPNEYDRVRIPVFTLDNLEHLAETYLFADPLQLKRSAKLVPASLLHLGFDYVVWPVGAEWIL